ncbi:hypothetical protein CWS02_08805 [Enterobacter sp. EA-1]|nr:hypothetical protein CWS02_08805 [Enterobacter sp. EA-1]
MLLIHLKLKLFFTLKFVLGEVLTDTRCEKHITMEMVQARLNNNKDEYHLFFKDLIDVMTK